MPLEHSSSPAALHRNMHTLFGDIGKSPHVQSRKQAIAIALETQRRGARDDGGSVWGDNPFQSDLGQMTAEMGLLGGSGFGNASGGVVPRRDIGGNVDPVQSVITALTRGDASGGTSVGASPATPGTSNPAAPSSVPATNASAPPAANTQVQAQGIVSAPGTTVGGPSNPAPNANQILASAPNTTMVGGPSNPQPSAPGLQIANGVNSAKQLMQSGGIVPQRQAGGGSMPWFARQEARQLHTGPVLSSVLGRTDSHKVQVPSGSYVLPAAHIASMGHGNSIAGMTLAHNMFGMPMPPMGHGRGPPAAPHGIALPTAPGMGVAKAPTHSPTLGFAGGGHPAFDNHPFEPVDVDISGGEYVIPPWAIIHKFGSLKNGHKILDHWIMHRRSKEIETQKKLPPPAKRWMGGSVGLELALAA
jgi:hypothetical protein